MARKPWRFRECLSCHAVFAGGQLRPVQFGGGHWHQEGGSLRRCPNCGHQGVTQDFPIIPQRPVTVR